MFWPTWPSSGVYDISLFIPEGICFAAFVAFVACGYSMQFLICVCFCCVSVSFHILVCVFGFLAFLVVCQHATKATKAAKQIPSGINSEISYTPEDGHVGRNT
jgi:hypothetical protein